MSICVERVVVCDAKRIADKAYLIIAIYLLEATEMTNKSVTKTMYPHTADRLNLGQ